MSNESPPAKKRSLLSRLVPRSVAGKTALATALVLVPTLVVVWTIRRFGTQSVTHAHAITWTRMAIELALVVIIPTVLYWGLRRWNQVIEGVYPDIDKAWQAGVLAMEAQGINVDDHPIFLILGSSSSEQERGLIGALGTKLSLDGIPNESGINHALQWYTSSDAIYLFCPGASALSELLGRWSAAPSLERPRRPLPVRDPNATAPGGSKAAAAPSAADNVERQSDPEVASQSAEPPASEPPQQYLGTLQVPSMAAGPIQPTGHPDSGRSLAASRADAPAERRPASPFEIPAANPSGVVGTVSVDHLANTPAGSSPATGLPSDGALSAGAPSAGAGAKPLSAIPMPNTNPPDSTSPTANKAFSPAGHDRDRPQTNSPAANFPAANSPALTAKQNSGPASPLAPLASAPRSPAGNLALPAALDTSDQLPRLRYVCNLLRRIRRPRCGVNGIVTLIPFELSTAGPLQLSALAQSARGDVNAIQETLGIRSPVTAMLIGLEQDIGFTELVRRLQPELLSRRLGGRFDLRSRPTPEELNAHSDRLCDAFEDWVYRLFGRDDALAQQRGNRKLYGLISSIRHELKPRLRIVLGQAFGCEPGHSEPGQGDPENGAHGSGSAPSNRDHSFFFSGCYFAASGATTGQPAFVKGVLQDKLIEEQSQVEWTTDALRIHRLFRALAVVGWVVTAVLAALFLARWLELI